MLRKNATIGCRSDLNTQIQLEVISSSDFVGTWAVDSFVDSSSSERERPNGGAVVDTWKVVLLELLFEIRLFYYLVML